MQMCSKTLKETIEKACFSNLAIFVKHDLLFVGTFPWFWPKVQLAFAEHVSSTQVFDGCFRIILFVWYCRRNRLEEIED